jgi:predicted ABC-type ATPase
LFKSSTSSNEGRLIRTSINGRAGQSKRVYVLAAHDGLDVKEIAQIEGLTPVQVIKNIEDYSNALEKADSIDKKVLRRAIFSDDSILNDSEKQFINMRLDGVSLEDMAVLHGKSVNEAMIDQIETMNKLNSNSIMGSLGMGFADGDKESYLSTLGLGQNASQKEIRNAFRQAASETLTQNGLNSKEFNNINNAYQALSSGTVFPSGSLVTPAKGASEIARDFMAHSPFENIDNSGNMPKNELSPPSIKDVPPSAAQITSVINSTKSMPTRWSDEEIETSRSSGVELDGASGITGRMSTDATKKALEDLMRDANEPLDKDLEDFVEFNNQLGMPIVRHPLVMWIGPMMPGIINKQYKQKLEAVAKAKQEKNWTSYIQLHERPYRLDAFMNIKDEMSDADYWSKLSDIWVDSENIWQNMNLWKSVLSSKRPNRQNMMTVDEQKELASMPDKIDIYRGFVEGKNKNGFSWTTDRAKAEWFSSRLAGDGENPLVAEARVNKKDVVAYFSRRGESEIVLSKNPKITGSMDIGPSDTPVPQKTVSGRKKKGSKPATGVTGSMGLFDRFRNTEPEKPKAPQWVPAPYVPSKLPKMNDSVGKRIGFTGKLSTYNPANYTSSNPSTTMSSFIATKDEPFIALDATFGGTTKIKEDRFWDLYQPIAVALSKSVTKKRKDGAPKRFISVGGPPGSGKSTLRLSGKHEIPLTDAAVHIDADEMKTLIPEAIELHRNGNPRWGDVSHEESRIMADVALKVGLENDHDVVYDSTGQFNSGFGTLKAAREKGYEIIAHYNVAPEDILEDRIDAREKIDPRRLPRHIIPAVNRRNYDIMPTVAKSADEFYLWDTNVAGGAEPKLLARKIKGGEIEILDQLAYAHGKFDDKDQAINMSKPEFKMNPRKVSKGSYAGKIITEYESGLTVDEIAQNQKISKHQVFDAIVMNEIDPSLPEVTYKPQSAYQPSLFPELKPRMQESLSDSQAMNQYRNLSSTDKAVLRDFVAKKPGVSLEDMTERVPMDLVIWAAKQKPEHIKPLGQIRSIEKLENLSPTKRQQLTEMLQGGESVVEIANALNLPFSVIDVAMDFVDQYGYIPEADDTEEKTVMFDSVSKNRLGRILGKTIKASILNGVVINER